MQTECISNSPRVLEAPAIQIDENLTYEEAHVVIVNKQVTKLRSRTIMSGKSTGENISLKKLLGSQKMICK